MTGDDDKGAEARGGLDRRTFVKRSLIAGGLLTGAGAAIAGLAEAAEESPRASAPAPTAAGLSRSGSRPNILVILVDQLRFPQWFGAQPGGVALPPNMNRLRRESVSFDRHYTASNDCSPSRSALLTGLYTHQTGCMITGGSTLDPGFPTWGTMLREHGYHTWWYGKWHLTHRDNRWTRHTGEPELERYGFSGGTYPSPDGGPGQGFRRDPYITEQFESWLKQEGGNGPWCTTVSLVNPHDIAWWYQWTDRVPEEVTAPSVIHRLPPNFETPEQLLARRKPRLQLSFQETTATSFGAVPFTGPDVTAKWLRFTNLYAKLQREVDGHVGRILGALQKRPEIAANTVVIFTSDHGEYGGSHGLRGKGASAYEECIRVPLLVRDPRGILAKAPSAARTQLTSSVDIAPLLLTIAAGSDAWRRDARYSHLAERLDLTALLADPTVPGRSYVLHATDEIVTEYAIELYAAHAPLHVVAIRTPQGKYATYSNWETGSTESISASQEHELYDYATQAGRLELENVAGNSRLEESLREDLELALREELRRELPDRLQAPQQRGLADYYLTARTQAREAAKRRKVLSERRERADRRHAAAGRGKRERLHRP